jgi:hypothetical protein
VEPASLLLELAPHERTLAHVPVAQVPPAHEARTSV